MKTFNLSKGMYLFIALLSVLFISLAVVSPAAALAGAKLALVPMAARPGAVAMPGAARTILDKFRQKMAGNNIVITPGYLRDDYLLSTGVAIGTVPFTLTQIQTGSTPYSTAQRLKNNDAFCVTDIGIFIGKSAATSAVTSASQAAAMKLHTFANGLVFTAGTDAVQLQAIYNGWLSIKEASTTYFETLECMQFQRVGTAQQGTLVFTASNTDASEWAGSKYAKVDITPQFQMAGNRSYQINLNLPAGINITVGSTTNTFAVIRFGGFLATGGARFI
jgi:hypothetical protein